MDANAYIDAEQLPFTRAEVSEAARMHLDEAGALALADVLAAAGQERAAARAAFAPSASAVTPPSVLPPGAPLRAKPVPIPFLVFPPFLLPSLASLSPALAERVRRFVGTRRARGAGPAAG